MWAHCAPLLAIRSMDAVVATICLFPPRGHRSVKATIAVLALVLVLQTAFILSQGQNEANPGTQSPSESRVIATEVNRLSTEMAALKSRVSVLETGTATPTSTPSPTSTTTPTLSPILIPYFVVTVERANVREGPGPFCSVITTVGQGERFDVDVRNPSGTWLEFCCVKGQRGWIYSPLVDVSVDVTTLPVADNIPVCPTPTSAPTPTASSPTPTRTNTPTPTPPWCNPHNPHGPDCDCADFSTQQEAQACFIAAGGPERDPHRLDGDNDGIACEHLP